MEQDKLTENQKTIIKEMDKNPRITQWELSVVMHLDESTVRKNIRILKLKGIVRRLGPRYKSVDRRWEVLK